MNPALLVWGATLALVTAGAVWLTVAACALPPLWLLAAPLDVAVGLSWSALADLGKPGGWLGP